MTTHDVEAKNAEGGLVVKQTRNPRNAIACLVGKSHEVFLVISDFKDASVGLVSHRIAA